MDWLREHVSFAGDECLTTWPFYRNPNGYGQLGINRKGTYAHRVMCELVHGPCPEGKEAAHSCGNGKLCCVNPKHLSWKTKSENRIDALRHGTGVLQRTGSRGSLSAETVAEIRSLEGTARQADIAARYGISEPRLRAIFANKIYRADKKIASWDDAEESRLRRALADGLSFPEAAKLMGRKLQAIRSRAYLMGLSSGRPVQKIQP